MKKEDSDTDKKESSEEVKKTFSQRRGAVRFILGAIALLLWILIGVSPTIIFSSALQQSIGVISFFYRNPIAFLLVAFINIALGLIVIFTIAIYYWAAFHFLWSIRWFYGYGKYRKEKSSGKLDSELKS
ncbi:hypothetical protein [Methanobacterium oryzae]|uniref:hypothetical protein n=1 Tax=Methanobacterium oryzae TaxID=69540 RepID=UPI003D1A5204